MNDLPPHLFERLQSAAKDKLEHCGKKTKTDLIQKFNVLVNSNSNSSSNRRECRVTNLSSRQLDQCEVNVLSKGLNFATVHSDQDVIQFISNVDPIIDRISDISSQDRTNLRQKVATSVHACKKQENISKAEKQALTRLRKDKTIVIAQADKTKEPVVLDKSDYQAKVQNHLDDSNTYEKIQNNPQSKIQYKVNRLLSKLKEEKKISKQQYDRMYCSTAVTPKFYGLIKTHKENNPIRPIISFIGSPTYQISKFLSSLLTPFTNLSDCKLKNSIEAKECLKTTNLDPREILVSFDVKSLFTSIPINLARECVENCLSKNDQLL